MYNQFYLELVVIVDFQIWNEVALYNQIVNNNALTKTSESNK